MIVGGVTCPGTGATRTWKFHDNNANHFAGVTLSSSYPRITVACYYTPGVTIRFWNQFDTIIMSGNLGLRFFRRPKRMKRSLYSRS